VIILVHVLLSVISILIGYYVRSGYIKILIILGIIILEPVTDLSLTIKGTQYPLSLFPILLILFSTIMRNEDRINKKD
jgi:hypothetical protein